METLNYYPNQLAANLSKKRTMLVGLIVPDVSHSFYGAEIKYIEEYLHNAGYKLLLCNAGDSKSREKEYLFMLQCNKVDGIIIGSHTLHLEDYGKVSLPIVALDRYLGKNIPTVSSDHEQGGRLAAEELLRAGCKKIAQIKGYSAVPTPSNERHFFFRKVIEEHHIECLDYELPLNAFRFMEYLDFVQDVFANEPDIDGVFAADNIACAVYKIACALNIKVPENLKIVGYDGTEISLMCTQSLSTVVQPIKKIAQTTVDTLLSMISEDTRIWPDIHIKLPVTFMRRDTTI
ncbi:LacI family transcriptional regulator [Spirochaetia bacterium]|nr:LacI family transcriptional regulator [Spirochaetia bacterium]